MPHLSIIVLNDNNVDGLRATLNSVFAQAYKDFECIIADNGSSDDSISVINENINNIEFFISEKYDNKLQLVDKAVSTSSGIYVLVINSGNILCNQLVIQELLRFSSIYDIIYGNVVKSFRNLNEVVKFDSDVTAERIVYQMPDIFSVSLVKRQLFLRHKFYDSDLTYVIEWAFMVNLFFTERIEYKYIDVDVCTIAVGRHGGVDKLSNVHLAAKEKQWYIQNKLPQLTSRLMVSEITLNQKKRVVDNIISVKYAILLHKKLESVSKYIKFNLRSLRSKVELLYYKKKYAKQCLGIPIIINNKNHVTYLKKLINSLEKRGYYNIHIIDNASTYGPLLDFYEQTNYKVYLLENNIGFCALWDTEIFDLFKDQYYVYTDSDLEIIDECPDDFMVIMHYLINRYSLGKAGFSLLTNDLPSHFLNRNEVIEWEARFSNDKVDMLAYSAAIDTTFALYKPNAFGDAGRLLAFRTSYPYSARHLPWYEDSNALTAEQLYYYKNAKTSSHWSSKIKADV